jgi:hypothetical protein
MIYESSGYVANSTEGVILHSIAEPLMTVNERGLTVNRAIVMRDTILQGIVFDVDDAIHDVELDINALGSVTIANHLIAALMENDIVARGYIDNTFTFQEYAPLVTTSINASYVDQLTLVYNGGGDIPDIVGGLDTRFRVNGVLTGSTNVIPGTDGGEGFSGAFRGTMSVGDQGIEAALDYRNFVEPDGRSPHSEQLNIGSEFITIHHSWDYTRSVAISMGTSLFGQLRYGKFGVYFDHTLEFEGIYFSDGSTPESHGFEVILASGLPSPNLILPEPSSFVLAAIGLIGLVVWKRRKR